MIVGRGVYFPFTDRNLGCHARVLHPEEVDTLARARQKSLPCEGIQPSLVLVNYRNRLEKRESFLCEVWEAFCTAWL